MVSLRLDTTKFDKAFRNAVAYSNGFFDGVEKSKAKFNAELATLTIEILGKFIDAKARTQPTMLHHVYEWGQTGRESARLFEFQAIPTQRSIKIVGSFLPSRSVSESSDEPLVDKANIMENRIAIEIEPRNSNVLVFEDEGETIFTTNSIYIASPGGDQVAGAFGATVEEFFDFHFTNMVLLGVLRDKSSAREFTDGFAQGVAGGGASAGKAAGEKYLSIDGMMLS